MKFQCPPPSRSGSLDSEVLKDCCFSGGVTITAEKPLTCAYFFEQNFIFLKDINNGIL